MQTELTKQFIRKTIRKVFIFAFLMVIVSSVTQAMNPVVTNEMAMGQMQNSNEMYILMETYNKIRPVFSLIYGGIIVWFTYGIGRDIYKFAKTLTKENT